MTDPDPRALLARVRAGEHLPEVRNARPYTPEQNAALDAELEQFAADELAGKGSLKDKILAFRESA